MRAIEKSAAAGGGESDFTRKCAWRAGSRRVRPMKATTLTDAKVAMANQRTAAKTITAKTEFSDLLLLRIAEKVETGSWRQRVQ